MSDPELPWELLSKEDGVYLHLPGKSPVTKSHTLINLGPKEQVMEAFSQFLAHNAFSACIVRKSTL